MRRQRSGREKKRLDVRSSGSGQNSAPQAKGHWGHHPRLAPDLGPLANAAYGRTLSTSPPDRQDQRGRPMTPRPATMLPNQPPPPSSSGLPFIRAYRPAATDDMRGHRNSLLTRPMQTATSLDDATPTRRGPSRRTRCTTTLPLPLTVRRAADTLRPLAAIILSAWPLRLLLMLLLLAANIYGGPSLFSLRLPAYLTKYGERKRRMIGSLLASSRGSF